MARKYQVTATFSLATSIEPDVNVYDLVDADDVDDSSSFYACDVESDGGEVSFVVEAANEDAAYDAAREAFGDDAEAHDGSIYWSVTNVDYSIELIEEPMTLARAREILTNLANAQDDEEVSEAVGFVFDAVSSLETRLHETSQRVDALLAEIREAREALAAATAVADGDVAASA